MNSCKPMQDSNAQTSMDIPTLEQAVEAMEVTGEYQVQLFPAESNNGIATIRLMKRALRIKDELILEHPWAFSDMNLELAQRLWDAFMQCSEMNTTKAYIAKKNSFSNIPESKQEDFDYFHELRFKTPPPMYNLIFQAADLQALLRSCL